MPKLNYIEFGQGVSGERIAILHEDRSVMAVDKPSGWMLAPASWRQTGRNLQAAIETSIAAGDFWARSRNLKYLRFVHRLDAETSGVLLLVKSPGALGAYHRLFESRQVKKVYLAVVQGVPQRAAWICRLRLAPDSKAAGRVKVDSRRGKDAETHFRVLQTRADAPAGPLALVEARPVTGRTHQIRVHLAEAGHPVVGDTLYGQPRKTAAAANPVIAGLPVALRAEALAYSDPFDQRRIRIEAPSAEFIRQYGFESA